MTSRLADAYDLVAEAFATLALELRAAEKPAAPSFEELPFGEEDVRPDGTIAPAKRVHPDEWERQVDAEPHGSAAVCPAHNIPYRPGRKGPYCPAQSDELNWSYVSRKDGNSYCGITPKSAAAWLRQHAQAGAR